MGIILKITIQVNLVLNPNETWRRQHIYSAELLLLMFYQTITAISWLPP